MTIPLVCIWPACLPACHVSRNACCTICISALVVKEVPAFRSRSCSCLETSRPARSIRRIECWSAKPCASDLVRKTVFEMHRCHLVHRHAVSDTIPTVEHNTSRLSTCIPEMIQHLRMNLAPQGHSQCQHSLHRNEQRRNIERFEENFSHSFTRSSWIHRRLCH